MIIRARNYIILNASAVCKECGRWTHVIAIALPPEHEVLEDQCWESASMGATVFYVADLGERVRSRVGALSMWYRRGSSGALETDHWTNHCEHCGTSQDDHDLHCEPGGAFVPLGRSDATPVHCLVVNEPFEGSADGYSYEPAN